MPDGNKIKQIYSNECKPFFFYYFLVFGYCHAASHFGPM